MYFFPSSLVDESIFSKTLILSPVLNAVQQKYKATTYKQPCYTQNLGCMESNIYVLYMA